MIDPSSPVVMSAFGLAAGLFFVGMLWQEIRTGSRQKTPPSSTAPGSLPPPIPLEVRGSGVSDGPYSRMDLWAIGLIFLLFGWFTWSNLQVHDVNPTKVRPAGLVVSMLMQITLALIVVLWVASRHPVSDWLGLRWSKWKSLLWLTPLTLLGVWAFMITLGLALQHSGILEWLRGMGVETAQDSVKLLQQAQDPMVIAMMSVAAMLVAPICEELVFRGYFYPAMKHHCGMWCAALVSALVFSAAHASLMALLPLFLLGLVFVWLYEKTGSIWAPIALHFGFNSATVVLQLLARWYHLPIDTP